MFRRLRLAALPIVAALVLTGCPSQDAKRSDVVNALEDAGLSEREAACIGDGFEEEFTQDQLNDLGSADSPEEFPEGTEETVDSIVRECTGESAPTDEGDEDGGEGSEATTTTGG